METKRWEDIVVGHQYLRLRIHKANKVPKARSTAKEINNKIKNNGVDRYGDTHWYPFTCTSCLFFYLSPKVPPIGPRCMQKEFSDAKRKD
jgi:hypothetical protein